MPTETVLAALQALRSATAAYRAAAPGDDRPRALLALTMYNAHVRDEHPIAKISDVTSLPRPAVERYIAAARKAVEGAEPGAQRAG